MNRSANTFVRRLLVLVAFCAAGRSYAAEPVFTLLPTAGANSDATDSSEPAPLQLPEAGLLPVQHSAAADVYAQPRAPGSRFGRVPGRLPLPEEYAPESEVPTFGSHDGAETVYGGVTPYGGGHPYDWSWGCGGSPFRTGPGWLDDWKVGPVWNSSVDGMTLFREDVSLAALRDQAVANGAPPTPDYWEQFDFGAGGRVFVTGWMPAYVGYQMQFGYEGVDEWNAAVVFPKVPVPEMGMIPPDTTEQRSVHYSSSLHSAELNVLPGEPTLWRPYFGVRYVRFGDEISEVTDQTAPPPLLMPDDPPLSVSDMSTIFDIKNNLIGFQSGLRYDVWQLSPRISLQGYINAGVYYNHIQRTDLMSTKTTLFTADDSSTMDTDETSTSVSTTTSAVKTEPADIAYLAEASLTGVCRVNESLALRCGYQIVWIDGLRLASDAYLNTDVNSRGLWFDGWHAGIEYRR